tara:strand:+ start:1299 stop:2081 length:783 start_codon:yes stop_codon:yes gene_type:complete
MNKIPKILSIAGSDSGGGAGIQADIKAISFHKGYAMTVLTAVTAQNTLGVQEIFPLPKEIIKKQLESVLDDLTPDVIKTGMLADHETIELISEFIENKKIVVDPVMVATSGDRLIESSAVEAIMNFLIPNAYLVTPNIYEAEILSNIKIIDLETQIEAGKKILEHGAENVLIKGGHSKSEIIHDCLIQKDLKETVFKSKRLDSKNTHGTGCSLASSIATLLGRGFDIEAATSSSIEYVQNGIKKAPNFGQGNGPILHFDD